METDKRMETEPSSSDDDDEENALETKTEELERQISENAYLYDVHVELVELYRKLADLKSMRAAYERFHKYFPLTPDLWLGWIHDEIKVASSSDEKKNVLNLFDKAVEDYQSVTLWQEYAQFSIGVSSLEETRDILERGLNSVGLHVAHGSLLWDTLRELELAHLALAESDSEQFQHQLHKVAEVYRRQLSVPLLDMENTFGEWTQFLKQLPDDHGIALQPIEWGYTKALKQLELYRPFEKRLLRAHGDDELYTIYKEYVNVIKDPSLLMCTYERAVSQMCLNVSLWEDYCTYSMKLGDVALKINAKALRNCPWNIDLWTMRLKMMEQFNKSDKEVLQCFEEAISSMVGANCLPLWLSYIEYVKRTSDDKERLYKLFEQANEQLGMEGDPSFKLKRFKARLMARNNDIISARKIWSAIMHNPENKATGNLWLEYVALEKQFGETSQVRIIFQKAMANCKDWQEYFADEWLMFEREVGTLQDVLKCIDKCKRTVKSIVQNNSDSNSSYVNVKKRNFDEEQDSGGRHKRQRTFNDVHNLKETRNLKERFHQEGYKPVPKIQGPPTDINPDKTVFVSNLHLKVTESKLKMLFPNSLKITIPTDRKGISRCFAYIQFDNEEDASQTLTRDREPIDGRPMFISKCQTDRAQRNTVFKYSEKLELNKLFVKGLPKDYTKDNIEAIFKPYGATDIRMVTKFNGQFKGLAYVDFANDEDAAKALSNTDQMTFGEHTITVAISAPPNKKDEKQQNKQPLTTRNSKSRLEIPFVPRSVHVKNTPVEEGHVISKTNDDFRKMLLNK